MTIKHFLTGAAGIVAALSIGSAAGADVLSFDDLSGTTFFTSNYHGFQIGNNDPATTPWFSSSQKLYDTSGNVFYQAHSGSGYIATDYTLYDNANYYQATQPISRSTAFVFNGAYFSGDGSIGYQLFLNNLPVFTTALPTSIGSTPMFVASGYSGLVDSVVVLGHQGFYALDDFTFNAAAITAAVPEPASWATIILGMGLVGYALRRRRPASVRVSFAG